jgi:hypothetical protein
MTLCPPFSGFTLGGVTFFPTLQAGFCPADNRASVGLDPRRAIAIRRSYEVVVGPVGLSGRPGTVGVYGVCARFRDAREIRLGLRH